MLSIVHTRCAALRCVTLRYGVFWYVAKTAQHAARCRNAPQRNAAQRNATHRIRCERTFSQLVVSITRRDALQTMMSTVSPFFSNSSKLNVNTPVISQLVDHCGTTKRRRRRSVSVVGLSSGSTSHMDINIPPTTLGLFANATPKRDNAGIALSEFNLTSPRTVPLETPKKE